MKHSILLILMLAATAPLLNANTPYITRLYD